MIDKEKITSKEADRILYSGEVPFDTKHFVEILDKIDKKEKEEKSGSK